jgi:ring-1,2-phenylacetyl-CoA epoxidase subunit PaaD
MVTTQLATGTGTEADRLRAAVSAVRDPEILILTIEELGILRDVSVKRGARPTITITPTYVGCPAMDVIRADIAEAACEAGFSDVEIVTVWSPAWTTDWLTDSACTKLAAAGIAPPAPRSSRRGGLHVGLHVTVPDNTRRLPLLTATPARPGCPHCGSTKTAELSRFGPTVCKALWRCAHCQEPFEHMKEH